MTAITAVKIPQETLYAWQAPTLTLSTPFIAFVAEDFLIYGLNCGAFTYTATAVKIIPLSPDPVKSLSIDQKNLTIDIGLDGSKIGAVGLTAEFTLTGKLASYSPFHTETLTVKVYTFNCTA